MAVVEVVELGFVSIVPHGVTKRMASIRPVAIEALIAVAEARVIGMMDVVMVVVMSKSVLVVMVLMTRPVVVEMVFMSKTMEGS